MECLPFEILAEIFTFLDVADVKDASLVCRRWYEASLHPFLQKKMTIHLNSSVAQPIKNLSNRQGFHLTLTHIDGSDRSAEALRNCQSVLGPRLLSLNLKGTSLNEKAFLDVLEQCVNLESLDISCCDSIFMAGYSLSSRLPKCKLPNLKHLNLASLRHLSDQTLGLLFGLSEQISSLSLASTKMMFRAEFLGSTSSRPSSAALTFSYLSWILVERAAAIKLLDFSRTSINDDCIEALVQIPNLKLDSLLLTNTTITNHALSVIAKFQPQLQNLVISHNQDVTKIGRAVSGMTQLRSLDVKKVLLNNQDLLEISGLPRLQALCLSSSLRDDFNAGKAEKFFTSLSQLTRLDMSYCSALSDQTLATVCYCLPNLEHLDLSSNLRLTDMNVCEITRSLPNLRFLSLAWCKRVTDVGLLGLPGFAAEIAPIDKACKCERDDFSYFSFTPPVKDIAPMQNAPVLSHYELLEAQARHISTSTPLHSLTKLRHLDLSVCPKLTDISVMQAIVFADLSYLNLALCVNLTDESLISLAAHNPLLETLNLNGCNKITDRGMKAIVAKCRRLKSIDLSACTGLSDETINFILRSCRKLKFINLNTCNISREAIDRLERLMPSLETIHKKYSGTE